MNLRQWQEYKHQVTLKALALKEKYRTRRGRKPHILQEIDLLCDGDLRNRLTAQSFADFAQKADMWL